MNALKEESSDSDEVVIGYVDLTEKLDTDQEADKTPNKRKQQRLSDDAKRIIMNVYEYIELHEGVLGAASKVARLTKVPRSTIRNIYAQANKERCPPEDQQQ